MDADRHGDALDHDPFERTLPKLPHQEPGEELLLGLGRRTEERRQFESTSLLASRACRGSDPLESCVDPEQLEHRLVRRCRTVTERGPSDADRSLWQPT